MIRTVAHYQIYRTLFEVESDSDKEAIDKVIKSLDSNCDDKGNPLPEPQYYCDHAIEVITPRNNW